MLFFSKRGMKDSNKHKSFAAFSFIMKKNAKGDKYTQP